MNFLERAQYTASKGIPVIRVRSNSKAAMDVAWPELATTNIETLKKWGEETPDANCAAVAKAEIGGFWYLEIDDAAAVLERIRKETGKEIPSTYRVRSRPNRGHFYWRHTPASIAAGNISQSYVKNGDWSARMSNAYVVSAFSIHPHSQQEYTPLSDEPVIECPDWLIAWLLSQKVEKKSDFAGDIPKDARGLVPHGFIHGHLVTHAGKLRNLGLDIDTLESALVKFAEETCAPPLDLDKVRQVARSFGKYPPGQNTDLLLTQPAQTLAQPEDEVEELPQFENQPYPVFPQWVMESTSLYEHFVKPVCAVNSRIPYFMWLPAMQILLNYIGPKVKIKTPFGPRPFRGSIYTVIVGRKGKTNKSSSVQDAMSYFNYIGCLSHANRDMKNAEGRVLTWTAGSPEGLGIEAQKTNCRNMILFYDELSQLVAKAGIESSALSTSLLTMYEAGKFANSVKSTKEAYALEPDTYCTSLIACTTDKKFAELWSRLAGSDTGLDDRFMFILQPESLPTPKIQTYVNTVLGSIETKKLIDKAVQKVEFEYEDTNDPRLQSLVEIENRYANRAEKWALALAVDLGLDKIDSECIERAVAIVKYEIDVKNFLKSYEATTREGQIQQEIRRVLEQKKGFMSKRDLERIVHADRYGTSLWKQAYFGLLNANVFREEGQGTRSNPLMVRLLKKRDLLDD